MTFRTAVAAGAAVVLAATGLLVALPALAAATIDRTLTDNRIAESSGLAISTRYPGVLYTHNDSGDGPRLFAVNADGTTAAVLTLRGAPARDWEAVAPGRRGSNTLWVGDIGDNITAWPSVRVYRVREPKSLVTQDIPWTRFDLRYPDGSHDAESLLVHPTTGRLYVVTKVVMGSALYEAPAKLSSTSPNLLRRVSPALPYATDAAFSPDGTHYVVRGYVDAEVYATAKPGVKVATIDLPAQPRGESIAWSADGRSLYVGSEGLESKVFRIGLPSSVTSAGVTPTTSPTARATTGVLEPSGPGSSNGADGGRALPRTQVLWLGAGAIVLIALGFSLRSWGKRDPAADES